MNKFVVVDSESGKVFSRDTTYYLRAFPFAVSSGFPELSIQISTTSDFKDYNTLAVLRANSSGQLYLEKKGHFRDPFAGAISVENNHITIA